MTRVVGRLLYIMTFPNCDLCGKLLDGALTMASTGIGHPTLYFCPECYEKAKVDPNGPLGKKAVDTSKSPPNVLTTWQEQKE